MTDPQHDWQRVKAEALRAAAAIILPLDLTISTEQGQVNAHLGDNLRFAPLGIEGMSAVSIYSPTGTQVMLVRGLEGAHSNRVSVHHRARVNVLEGSLLYFVDGREPILVEAWQPGLPDDCDRITFEANETHGFVVISKCLTYSVLCDD